MTQAAPIAGRTTAGAAWLIASRFLARLIDFASLLLLANYLVPQDFGLVAIAMTLVRIVEAVFELPVGQVLVRAEAISRPMLETAFTLSVIRSAVLAVGLALLAIPFGYSYGDARLVPLICFIALAPALRGLVSPKMAQYAKDISFHRDLIIEVGGRGCAFVAAAACAILTRSYWAIAAGTVVAPAFMVLASYWFAPFRPRFGLGRWREFADLLGWTTAAQAVTAINWQIDRLVLGFTVSRAQLGTFSLASDLASLPDQAVLKPTIRPLLAAFSMVRHDPERLREAYLRTTSTIVSAVLPVLVAISILAQPLVAFALGPKWQPASPLLQWLVLAMIPTLFAAALAPLAMALGQTAIFFRQSLCELCIKVPATILGALYFGVAGAIAARAGSSLVMGIVSAAYVRSLIGVPLGVQLVRPWRAFAASAVMAALLLALRPWLQTLTGFDRGLGLVGVGAGGMMLYLVVLMLVWQASGRPRGIETVAADRIRRLVSRRARGVA
jgi:O-antigen/teichoic acid export membrane protein